MPSNLGLEIDKAYEELRNIDSEIAVLSGRTQVERNNRRRLITNNFDVVFDSSYSGNDRRVFKNGHRQIVLTASNNLNENGYNRKRIRHNLEDDVEEEDDDRLFIKNSRTLQSSVVMPTIETKSRAEIITEIKKSEKKEDTVRNRRLFSNLIVGTLKQFQKEETTCKNKIQAQTEKQREIERRLELTEKENREKLQREKKELLARRREKEKEIMRLKREKAIMKYAEEKEQHFRRLQCFIQTNTKPPIFFLPAKHTLRTLELLKDSAKKVEGLIALRREEMERELYRGRATNSATTNSDEEDVEEDLPVGVKSAVVAVINNAKEEREQEENKN